MKQSNECVSPKAAVERGVSQICTAALDSSFRGYGGSVVDVIHHLCSEGGEVNGDLSTVRASVSAVCQPKLL